MGTSKLPERASLEYLKKLAKERLAQMRGVDPTAKLAGALLEVAREHGFSSWRKLKEEVDGRREHAVSRFFDACAGGDLETVRAMLAAEPALARMVDPKGEHGGWTGLHYAARHGRLEVAQLLLAHGADPNAREAGDNTYPLHWAASHRHIEVVRALLDAGGDAGGSGDLHELGAIGWATYFHRPGGRLGERPEVAQLLVEHGARHHVYSAMSLGDLDLLRRVVEHDPDQIDRRMSRFENRLTPLHFAVKQRRPDMVDVLIELGADVEAVDGDGHTALEAALLAGDTESARRLEAAGARVPQPRKPEAVNLAGFATEVKRITPMLQVPDVGRTLEWYVSLGFSEQSRYEEGGVFYWAMLSLGAANLMLNLGEATSRPPLDAMDLRRSRGCDVRGAQGAAAAGCASRRGHGRRVRAASIRAVLRRPRVQHSGSERLYVDFSRSGMSGERCSRPRRSRRERQSPPGCHPRALRPGAGAQAARRRRWLRARATHLRERSR